MSRLFADLRALVEIARQTFVRQFDSRFLWLVLAGDVVVALAAYGVGRTALERESGRHLYCAFAWVALASVQLPWTTMYFAIQAVHGDLEDRSFQYLFLRPVSRWVLLVGKWLAVGVQSSLLLAFGAVVLFAGLAAHPGRWGDGREWSLPLVFAGGCTLAAFAYAAVGALFAARFRRPLVWSVVYIFGLSYVLGSLPARAGLRRITVVDPMRRFLLDRLEPDQRLANLLWPAENNWRLDLVGQPVVDLLVISGVALVLAAWFWSRAEYDSRPRE